MWMRVRASLTYANVVATLALFAALGGGAYAATKINGKDIKNRSIAGKKLKRNTLGGTQIRESRLRKVPSSSFADRAARAGRADSATRADSASRLIGPAGSVQGLTRPVLRSATATGGATDDAAQAAAPAIPLLTAGPFTIYGKCFRHVPVRARIYVRSSTPGAVFQGGFDGGFVYDGSGPRGYLGPDDTDENELAFHEGSEISLNSVGLSLANGTDFAAVAANGFHIRGVVGAGAKLGNPPAGSGPFPSGASCIFQGYLLQG